MMVQKALSAKSLSHAQGATLLTGWIKVLPLFLIVVPGMISRVLYPDEVGCVDPELCLQICQVGAKRFLLVIFTSRLFIHCEKYLGCYVEGTARSVTLTEIIDSHA